MKFSILQAALGSASILFSTQVVSAGHGHGHRHAHDQYAKRHTHAHQRGGLPGAPKAPRKATCSLPDHPDLVHVPGADNNGFAMSPDEPCEDGKWCPIACVSGKVMAQWKPNTTYNYPESMYGGLYCNGGKVEKPFEDSPYCVDGTGAVKAVNKAGKIVSFCQTVLPGNEAMIIPTDVTDTATLAVPGPDYWAGTAAHYYVNAPGIAASMGCVWGKISEAIGNWSPFVAGANTMANGETFVKIAWNPEFLSAPLAKSKPKYGIKIECPDGGCNGLPCSIDPSKDGVNGLTSSVGTKGVGGANFCVVTVPKGKTANIVVFDAGGSEKPATTSKAPSTPRPTTISTVARPPSSSTAAVISSWPSSEESSTSPASPSTTSDDFLGGFFQEQEVSGETQYYTAPDATPRPTTKSPPKVVTTVATTPSNDGAAVDNGGSAIAGLVVALVAAAALY
ncbi:putative secreted beta-glucosidase adg3 [Madurella mycetomatis]|uniref:Secreted beta-glucosidase adg3 n=1 Tax=Madurella mycetomatis TaxID=100816 RepID=A0A150ASJ9_9PEZI|nr:putative secreted beta-glucosidase adg3 [Madurella mycetomatis]